MSVDGDNDEPQAPLVHLAISPRSLHEVPLAYCNGLQGVGARHWGERCSFGRLAWRRHRSMPVVVGLGRVRPGARQCWVSRALWVVQRIVLIPLHLGCEETFWGNGATGVGAVKQAHLCW